MMGWENRKDKKKSVHFIKLETKSILPKPHQVNHSTVHRRDQLPSWVKRSPLRLSSRLYKPECWASSCLSLSQQRSLGGKLENSAWTEVGCSHTKHVATPGAGIKCRPEGRVQEAFQCRGSVFKTTFTHKLQLLKKGRCNLIKDQIGTATIIL